jgi:membrane protein DedA with SNARE-associated domain/rhodanese-related sulfurtransferase
VTEALDFLQRHAQVLLFIWIFVDQLGVPIPAVPLLLAAGALAGAGKGSIVTTVGIALVASLLADVVWFSLGRRRGHHVLAWLCRITLEPDSCVRRTEDMFVARGLQALLVTKFLPGLNAVAAALAGVVGVHAWRFLTYALVAGLLWAGSWTGVGYFFSAAIRQLVSDATHVGGIPLVALIAAVLAAYIVFKYATRRRFLRSLRIARITPEELQARLGAGEPVVILDLRSALDLQVMPYTIPGALQVAPADLARRSGELPRDRDIVLYCTCPNEATSARAALTLRQAGIMRVRPLLGGLEGWRGHGFPVEPSESRVG